MRPKLAGYRVIREADKNTTFAEAERRAKEGVAFVGVAGKVYEAIELED